MKILITSGGCKVPIDDVRHIGNSASGAHGSALASTLIIKGNEVTVLREKGSTAINSPGMSFRHTEYKDFEDYRERLFQLVERDKPEVVILTSAISDYIVDKTKGKISSDGEFTLKLKPAPKVIKELRELYPDLIIVGYKLMVSPTDAERWQALTKALAVSDLVVFNDLTELRKGKHTRWVYDQSGEAQYTYGPTQLSEVLTKEIGRVKQARIAIKSTSLVEPTPSDSNTTYGDFSHAEIMKLTDEWKSDIKSGEPTPASFIRWLEIKKIARPVLQFNLKRINEK